MLSDLIRDVRERLTLTQESLASELSVSLPTINRWEKGKTKPDKLALRALERFVRSKGKPCEDLIKKYFGGDHPLTADRTKHRDDTRSTDPLDTRTMEGMLWKAACSIRGEKDAPKFKDYILPLVFVKRLSDVFEDELDRLKETYGDLDTVRTVLEADREIVRFYIPEESRWPVLSGREPHDWPKGEKPKTLGERLTRAMRAIARANPQLQGVIDTRDFNETRNGEREISDQALEGLIETLSDPRYRLGLRDVESDFLGRAYEYLLRKFAEGQGQSAGEFFTPKEVGVLMAKIVRAEQGEWVYDPCCGSGGLLIKCQLELSERTKKMTKPLKLYGQEFTGSSFAIARMNMVLHDMAGEIARGNTMTNPKFTSGEGLRQFEVIVTNPMWNQDNFDADWFENDPFDRFEPRGGFAPGSSADWAWLQHVQASLTKQGRAAVVLDTGAVSRGSGNQGENKEKSIRRWFVDHDLIEGVILLPDNLFYNTTAAGVIVLLRNSKPKLRAGKVLFVNASARFEKGRPKNFLSEAAIRDIADVVSKGVDADRLAKLVTNEEIAKRKDYNLSPSAWVEVAEKTEHRDIQSILDELATLDVETKKLDTELAGVFRTMGYRWGGAP